MKPNAPTLIQATDDTITLQFYETYDNGGSEIIKYELYMNDGNDLNEPTTLVNQYNDNSMNFIVDKTDLTLTTGKIYKFKFRAINEKGDSEDSDIVRFALAKMNLPPSTIEKVKSWSSLSSIFLSWT